MRDYKQDVYDIADTTHVMDIPIEEFENLEDFRKFVEVMSMNGIGVVLTDEHSNFHQGVLVEVFDKKSCSKIAKQGLLR